jgi:hypothetical protein
MFERKQSECASDKCVTDRQTDTGTVLTEREFGGKLLVKGCMANCVEIGQSAISLV